MLGIVHVSRMSRNERESPADSAATDVETPISVHPPSRGFGKDTDEEKRATRSIRDPSREKERGGSPDPLANVYKLKDPPRRKKPKRGRREYRQQVMQMDVKDNTNAVILGSMAHESMELELEWGNAI